ncbi:MAG: ATP-binding cassette domain-containing protein [Thermoprotei archaeon]
MLEISGLVVRYGKGREALRGVSLVVGDGDKVAIVGPNGSGKSTLIKAVLGLAPIVGGKVRVFGMDVDRVSGETKVSTNLGEVYRLLNAPARELIQLYAELKGVPPENYLKLVEDFGLEEILGKKLFKMSSGQAKMFGNIMAFGSNPRLILLDEPFEDVDQSRRMGLVKMLASFEGEAVLVTHEFDLLIKFADWKLYFMLEGSLYGPFMIGDLNTLYISRGEKPNALCTIRTSFGVFTVTRGNGDLALKYATNIDKLIEEVA